MKYRQQIKPISKKGNSQVKEDEKTYEEVWESKLVKCCENCGVYLGEEFRNFEGKVRDKRMFSHILSKGAYPEMRNDIRNFNLLCPSCHDKWEFLSLEKRKKMAIYVKNLEVIQILKEEYNKS
jgi:hypothetical protein